MRRNDDPHGFLARTNNLQTVFKLAVNWSDETSDQLAIFTCRKLVRRDVRPVGYFDLPETGGCGVYRLINLQLPKNYHYRV